MTLRCWLEGLDGSRLRVGEAGLMLGQGAECAFRTLDTRVSPRHAEVKLSESGVFLTPRGIIPTVLNGRPVHNPRQLSDGDWIGLAPGVLFRVRIHRAPLPPWTVSDGETRHTLHPGTGPLAIDSAHILSVTPDGLLLLTFQVPIVLNSRLIEPDRRPWALERGDMVTLAGGRVWSVLDGPTSSTPPRPWTLQEPLRCHPPSSAARTEQGRLLLRYPGAEVEVTVRDSDLLDALLAATGPITPDPDALLRLQEDLIRGGVDGFCLLPVTAEGVLLSLRGAAATEPPGRPPVAQARRLWLSLPDGGRLWLDAGGVLLGRNPDCDITLEQPYIHRYHALIRQRAGQVEVVPLGRNPSYINGEAIDGPAPMDPDSWMVVDPGVRLRLGRTIRPISGSAWCTVAVQGEDGETTHTLRGERCLLGGPGDDLEVPGWPAGAVCLYLLQDAVFFETTLPARHGEAQITPRRAHRLHPDRSLTVAGASLTLRDHRVVPPRSPRLVVLQPFQSAGRILFWFDDRTQRRLCLPQHRYNLLHLLLEGYVSSRLRSVTQTRGPGGESDADLPRGATRLRSLQLDLAGTRRVSLAALRDLIHQVRTDLIRAGINGERMLEASSSWTRLQLGENCNVTLYS